MKVMRKTLALLGLTALVIVGGEATAIAEPSLSIQSQGAIAQRGGTAVVHVRVGCDPGYEVLEAFVTLSQDDQRVNGTGFISRIRCDGRLHRHVVRVSSPDGSFHGGSAHASGYLLVQDPASNDTQSAQHSLTIILR